MLDPPRRPTRFEPCYTYAVQFCSNVVRSRLATELIRLAGIGVSCLLLSGCGLLLDPFAGGAGPEEDWPEVFDFEMQPGDLVGDELEDRIMRFNPMDGELVPGSARHIAFVDGPGGRAEFYSAAFVNVPDEPGGRQHWCTMSEWANGGSAGCGPEPPADRPNRLQSDGAGASMLWQTAEFTVSDDTVLVRGVTDDGTEYTITPRNGFGWVAWRFDRGFMELTAIDAEGVEMESITIGIRECEIRGRC